ncbi:hypothetical protein P8C59_003178 [Phyllachora maydis]|uniref:Uncharacterized protein n=1 Tax=Phyllachora maydis TaxID=1825666 RepID=A0AAD9I0W6_9PEZI|nr:hypothetical protein P8C59_003178 [Phyllachora maydis]
MLLEEEGGGKDDSKEKEEEEEEEEGEEEEEDNSSNEDSTSDSISNSKDKARRKLSDSGLRYKDSPLDYKTNIKTSDYLIDLTS